MVSEASGTHEITHSATVHPSAELLTPLVKRPHGAPPTCDTTPVMTLVHERNFFSPSSGVSWNATPSAPAVMKVAKKFDTPARTAMSSGSGEDVASAPA